MARGGWFSRHTRNGTAEMPDGLWSKCPRCAEISFAKDVDRNLKVCPKCDYHHRLRASERLELTVDEGSFEEMGAGVTSGDPLGFPGYEEKLKRDRSRTGLSEGIITGRARVEGQQLVVGIADFAFRGGSMGSAVGEKLVRAMEAGEQDRLPVVLFTASGGARMEEGLLSLMQMAKTSAAVARLDRARVPYIVVLTDPTMAGVHASYASLGDIILAEPGALIGFAGRRVGNQDMGVKLPDDFQSAEFQFRCGMVDRVTPRKEIRPVLGKLLGFFAEERANARQPA
ncbi:MAG TPA: acetyl-CoA carboxylase, carboxyltransferase subunit beta [Chthonomonadales bacterium]|nr:acetyl-CoA carboxylase, carboxyltransferase subunit beta [Chthonomonadales bacterium]